MSVNGNSNEAIAIGPYTMDKQQMRVISADSSVVSVSASLSSTKSSSSTGIMGGGILKHLQPSTSSMGGVAAALAEIKRENEVFTVVAPAAPVPIQQAHAQVTHQQAVPAPTVSAIPNDVNPMILQMGAPPHPVAEFLFQLTKMLTDNNSEYIEWRNASIFVHDPPGLEKDILPKYFRHSNYSSFQRQMNYFGFRKIAGKGKMAPCSYVNEHAKEDISSLLFIKRKKTGVSSAAAKLIAQQNRINRTIGVNGMGGMQMGANSALMMGAGAMGVTALSSANPAISLNNFAMMGGLPGVGGAANINLMSAVSSINEQASLLREQQNMLAQLQQAHASALTNGQMGVGQAGVLQGIPQANQNKLNGLAINNVANNTNLLTNDQVNMYLNSANNSNSFNPNNTVAAQQLLLQQAAQQAAQQVAGNAGNFSQGMAGANIGDSNSVVRVDSAANLRALINQQISMFNPPVGDAFSSSAVNNLGAGTPVGVPMQSAGVAQPQASAQQTVAISTANTNQGPTYDLDTILQRTDANTPAGANSALQHFQQQLLQGNSVGTAVPVNQPFNLSGFFSTGAMANGPQGL